MAEVKYKTIIFCSACRRNLYWWANFSSAGGPLICENDKCRQWHTPQGHFKKEFKEYYKEKGIIEEGGTENVRDSQEGQEGNQRSGQAIGKSEKGKPRGKKRTRRFKEGEIIETYT